MRAHFLMIQACSAVKTVRKGIVLCSVRRRFLLKPIADADGHRAVAKKQRAGPWRVRLFAANPSVTRLISSSAESDETRIRPWNPACPDCRKQALRSC